MTDKMQSEILTVESNDGDSVMWQENCFNLSNDPFPILADAKPGEKFRVYYEYGCGVGYPVNHVERVED